MRLDSGKIDLIAGFMDTYLALTAKEELLEIDTRRPNGPQSLSPGQRPGSDVDGYASRAGSSVHLVDGGLVGAFDEQLVDAHMRRTTGHPQERFGHIRRRERLDSFVNLLGPRLVALEP